MQSNFSKQVHFLSIDPVFPVYRNQHLSINTKQATPVDQVLSSIMMA